MKVCTRPGCGHLTSNGGRCPDCTTTADRERGTRHQRGYDTRWTRRRNAYLRRPENLFCRLCGAPSTVADHWPDSRRDLTAAGVTDPDADHRLRPLCKPCHDRATAELQPGGWNTQ
jgi:5-methylcytosine-specific restriction protein A